MVRGAFLLLLSTLITLLPTLSASAQNGNSTLTGTVTDGLGKAIARVTCKLLDSNDSLLAYTLTKSDGTYSIKNKPRARQITFSYLGYESAAAPLRPGKTRYDATLKRNAIELDNVTVTIDPITRRKDTLIYNVEAFRQQEDRSIEDVLKRMPGIEIDDYGQISYQGKAINKVNIEGLDLMGNQYNQATQNMPAEAVAQVEVMERNQPIKALEDKVKNDRATLNLKLKKDYKARPFGEVDGGIGISPTIWNNGLTAFNIARKNQLMVSASMNNCGIDLSGMTHAMDYYGSQYNTEPLPQPFLYSPTARTPPLSKQYYLDNKSYYAALNYLHAFTKEQTLRLNVTWWRDNSLKRDSTFNRYVTRQDTVSIYENNKIRDKQDLVKGQLRYELNSRRWFINDEVSAMLSHGDALNRNGSNLGPIEEDVNRRTYYVQNVLNATLNTGPRLFEISSLTRFYRQTSYERASVQGGLPGQEAGPMASPVHYSAASMITRNRIGTSFSVPLGSLMLGYILEYKHNNTAASYLEGKQRGSYWLHTIEPVYEIMLGDVDINVNLPVEYISYEYGGGRAKRRKVMFSPLVDADFTISTLLTADLTVGLIRGADTQATPFNGIIINNYRTYTVGTDSLQTSRTATVSASLAWLNTASMLSWNIYAGWQQIKRERYWSYLYTGGMTVISPVWRDNRHTSWSVVGNMKKIWRTPGISLKGSVSYSYNKELASQNGTEDYIRYSAASADVALNWNKLRWLSARLTAAGNVTWKRPDAFSQGSNVLKNIYYTLGATLYPIAGLQIRADMSQATFEISHGQYSTNIFVNAGARYDITKTVAVMLTAVNLLDRRRYEESRFDGANYAYTGVPLRGREVMLGLNLKF